ncbi:hypothetical protein [Methylobacterium durans]|uniref:hypothetical protein n=1 Tax=Methylobacterium durans TaxID=2202825 RepID=UPI0013A58E82|nr:hypothetical protein [Methylobacterium durans]
MSDFDFPSRREDELVASLEFAHGFVSSFRSFHTDEDSYDSVAIKALLEVARNIRELCGSLEETAKLITNIVESKRKLASHADFVEANITKVLSGIDPH